jgi:hypothetical protein
MSKRHLSSPFCRSSEMSVVTILKWKIGLRWTGHVAYSMETMIVRRILVGKLLWNQSLRRSRYTWKDNIKTEKFLLQFTYSGWSVPAYGTVGGFYDSGIDLSYPITTYLF